MWFKLRGGGVYLFGKLVCSQNNHYCKGKSMPEDLLPCFALIGVQKGRREERRQPPAANLIMLIKQQDETGKPVRSDLF